ncbi:MAG TPA: hypothetical protein VGL23_00835 [Chloroflexota bacterium]
MIFIALSSAGHCRSPVALAPRYSSGALSDDKESGEYGVHARTGVAGLTNSRRTGAPADRAAGHARPDRPAADARPVLLVGPVSGRWSWE